MTRSSRMVGAARMAMVTLALLLAASPTFAQLRLDVTRGKVEPMPIAIPPFAGGGADESKAGRDIAQVVSADLERSGLFRPLDPQSFIQNVSAGEGPRFADWRQINAQALVTGSMQGQGDGRYRVDRRFLSHADDGVRGSGQPVMDRRAFIVGSVAALAALLAVGA